MCRKLSIYGRTACLCREHLSDLRCKKELCRKWKQVKTTQEEKEIFTWPSSRGQERRCRELQVSQPHHIPWKTVMQTFLEATSKHMERRFITTWIMHNLSRSPGSNELEGTSDTLGVGLPFRVMRTGRKNSAARILMKLKATTKSCIWDGVTCETVQLGVGGRPLQKGHVGPGGCLKVGHRSAVCPCGKEG